MSVAFARTLDVFLVHSLMRLKMRDLSNLRKKRCARQTQVEAERRARVCLSCTPAISDPFCAVVELKRLQFECALTEQISTFVSFGYNCVAPSCS